MYATLLDEDDGIKDLRLTLKKSFGTCIIHFALDVVLAKIKKQKEEVNIHDELSPGNILSFLPPVCHSTHLGCLD